MRTSKTHSLSTFQICNTVLLTIVNVLYITFPWHLFNRWKFWVQVFIWTCFHFFWKYLGVEWLDHMVGICLSIKETAKLFLKEVCPFYISTSSVWEFQLLHISYLIWSVFLILVILIGMCWYLSVVLICISLMTNDVEHLFMCLFAIFIFFFSDMSVHIFCPFKNIRLSFSYYWILRILYILVLCQMYDL